MPLYEIQGTRDEKGEFLVSKLDKVSETTFAAEKLWERRHIQRLLRDAIETIAPDTYVVAEELSTWEENKLRIDLLCIDKNANLVVVELKRDDEGGLMDLQALRYAAMISPLTFPQLVKIHAGFLGSEKTADDAQRALLEFLDWNESDENAFNKKMRIVLASTDFSTEVTTTVLWLTNTYGLDIRCVRMKPHNLDGRLIVDVQQVIPLPEAADYQVRIQEKVQQERTAKANGKDYTKFDVTIGGETYHNLTKGKAMFTLARHLCANGVTPDEISEAFSKKWQKPLATIQKWFWVVADGKLSAQDFDAALRTKATAEDKQYSDWKWFADADELIYSDGRTYALSKGWGGVNFIENLRFFRDTFGGRSASMIDVAVSGQGT